MNFLNRNYLNVVSEFNYFLKTFKCNFQALIFLKKAISTNNIGFHVQMLHKCPVQFIYRFIELAFDCTLQVIKEKQTLNFIASFLFKNFNLISSIGFTFKPCHLNTHKG